MASLMYPGSCDEIQGSRASGPSLVVTGFGFPPAAIPSRAQVQHLGRAGLKEQL